MNKNPDFNKILDAALAEQNRMTNGDKIRAMTDEELAVEFDAYICNNVTECDTWSNCTECKMNWLRQEARP